MDVIILNRMYAGDYLGENIGHEVINLIKPDNGNDYYVYINDDGRVNENILNKKWNVTCILFTRWCTREYKDDEEKTKTLSMIEILAKTEGTLECILDDNKDYKQQTDDFYEKHKEKLKKVTYGGNTLDKIFNCNEHYKYENPIYATFKAKKIIKVNKNKRIFIVKDPIENYILEQIKKENEEIININKNCNNDILETYENKEGEIKTRIIKQYNLNLSKQSLKQYITNGAYGKDKDFQDVYKNIQNAIIKKDVFWQNNEEIKTYNQMKEKELIVTGSNKNNFIGILRQEYDELIYTNLFFHIFKSNPQLFCNFAKKILKIGTQLNPTNLRLVREEGNIDLLMDDNTENNETLIVIENKIKSGINGIRHDENGTEVGNQLCKYALYTFGKRVKSGSDKHGYTYEDFSKNECNIKNYKDYKNRYFYIFAPKYKQFNKESINENIKKYLCNIDCKGKRLYTKYAEGTDQITKKDIEQVSYQVITYDDIYDFFKDYKFEKEKYPKPTYYDEFLYAIERHSRDVDNIQERQMFERFAERVEELNKPCPELT